MENHTDSQTSAESPIKVETSTQKLQSPSISLQEVKPFYFETETKRLKGFYESNRQQLLGRKILFNNSSGVVRYFGTLKHEGVAASSKNQLWVGIEWDEANRGKHNGTVNGYKYFTCDTNKGSMIKYEKIEFGYRLETALFRRYFRADELHHAKDIYDNIKRIKQEQEQISKVEEKKEVDKGQQKQNTEPKEFIKKIHKIEYDAEAYFDTIKKTKKIMIEFVGFDEIWTKIHNLDKIQSISLAECRICDLGQAGHLSGVLKSLKVLSLEDNLLSHWNQIYQLGSELPQLTELSVSSNSIAQPSEAFQSLKSIDIVGRNQSIPISPTLFANLRCLILINTGLSWKSFFSVVGAFKQVHQFILCKNDLSDVDNIDQNKIQWMSQTRFLNLESTNISSFSKLRVFSTLPHLQRLILNHNPLGQLGNDITGFTSLKHVSMQNCDLEKPIVLYQISAFAHLESLNVLHNPFGSKFGNAYIRMRAVAEISKLNQINGALLKKYERKDCEIYYMRESFREYFHFKKVPDYDYDFQDFLKYCDKNHPNMQKLIKRYGNPYEVQKKKQIKQIIKQQVKTNEVKKGTGMVQVQIQYKQTGSLDKKKLPLSWTVSSLKNFFSKTVKIPVNLLIITVYSDPTANGEEMIEDHKTLSFYNLNSNSRLIVQRRAS